MVFAAARLHYPDFHKARASFLQIREAVQPYHPYIVICAGPDRLVVSRVLHEIAIQ